MYYALITQKEEKITNEEYARLRGPKNVKSVLLGKFSKGHHATQSAPSPPATDSLANEKETGLLVQEHYTGDTEGMRGGAIFS
jgi:hypothetical protein